MDALFRILGPALQFMFVAGMAGSAVVLVLTIIELVRAALVPTGDDAA